MAMFAPTVSVVDNSQLVTPGPLGLTLTGYPPLVVATGATPTGGGRYRQPQTPAVDIASDDEDVLLTLFAA
jgi:hypothetical protein